MTEIFALSPALLAMAAILVSTVSTGVPPMPTSPRVRDEMLALLPAEIDGAVYELGSGWGGLAFALARRYPAAPVRGYEVSVLPWLWSRLRLIVQPCANLSFRLASFDRADLADAGLVACYLFPEVMARLARRLAAELPPGAHVVSNPFSLPDWEPVAVRTVADAHRTRVYLYRA